MTQEIIIQAKQQNIPNYLSSKEMFCGDTWYFRARKKFLTSFISPAIPAGSRVLDVGCGDGWLKEALPGRHTFGVETDIDLRREAELQKMPVFDKIHRAVSESGTFDTVTCFDVLEHMPDEDIALGEVKDAIKDRGTLYVSVPLHPEMWSIHDVNAHHFKRYRKGEVTGLLERHGFNILRRRYFISSPLFIIYAARLLFPGRETGMRVANWLDPALYWLTVFDTALKLPFGLTELVEARKK